MSSDTHNPATSLWSELLLRSMAELRELFTTQGQQLGQDSASDFDHLFEGGRRLNEMLAEPGASTSRHDLMNVLAAIRGYAELLLEDVGAEFAELNAALAAESLQGCAAALPRFD